MRLRRVLVAGSAAAATAAVFALPASQAQAADDYPIDIFSVTKVDSSGPTDIYNIGYTNGTITWYNRTAMVRGSVIDREDFYGRAVAYFEAYDGSTKIESTTRTADYTGDLGAVRDFNFTIGDTDRVGGIDRIKITVCQEIGTFKSCSSPENYSKS